jgi:hypothetical protein
MKTFRKIKIKQNNFSDYTFNIHIDKNNCIVKCINDSLTNDKIWISSIWKSLTIDMIKTITCKCYSYNEVNEIECDNCLIPKRILCINGGGLIYIDMNDMSKSFIPKELMEYMFNEDISDISDTEIEQNKKHINNNFIKIIDYYNITKQERDINNELKDKLLYDLNNQLINIYKVDICITSPTITSGISINDRYFHKSYCYGLIIPNFSIREYIQTLFRTRQLINKEINIFLNGKYFHYKNEVSQEKIKEYMEYIITNQDKLQSGVLEILNTTDNDNGAYISQKDKLYMECREINKCENYNSHQLWNQTFFYYMIYIHNIKFYDTQKKCGIRFVDICDKKSENDMKTKLEMKEQKQDRLLTEKINFIKSDIDNMNDIKVKEISKELQQEDCDITNKTYREYQKYRKLTTFYKYECVIMKNFIKNILEDNEEMNILDTLQESIDREELEEELETLYKVLSDKELLQKLYNEYDNLYKQYINHLPHLEKYNLHISSELQSKYNMINDIIKLQNDIDNEVDYDFNYNNKSKSNVDRNIIYGLLQFLDIDINTIDIRQYHYINETNKKYDLTGLKDKIMSNDNIKNINGNEISFIEFINDYCLKNITLLSNELKLNNCQKLNPINNSDYNDLHKILRYFLLKINMKIDYDNKNTRYKTTKLTIKQNEPILKINRDSIKNEWINEIKHKDYINDYGINNPIEKINMLYELHNKIKINRDLQDNIKYDNEIDSSDMKTQEYIYVNEDLDSISNVEDYDKKSHKIMFIDTHSKMKLMKCGRTEYYVYNGKKYRREEYTKHTHNKYEVKINLINKTNIQPKTKTITKYRNDGYNNIVKCEYEVPIYTNEKTAECENEKQQNYFNCNILQTYNTEKTYRYRLCKSNISKYIDYMSKKLQYINEDTEEIDIEEYNVSNHNVIMTDHIKNELIDRLNPNLKPIIMDKQKIIYGVLNDLCRELYETPLEYEKYEEMNSCNMIEENDMINECLLD